jgi:hypothetical protein
MATYLANVNVPSQGVTFTGGPIISRKPAAAVFVNESGNGTATGTAGQTSPILGFGTTSSSGDATLLAAFNKSTATFTAPYNGTFTFVGWQQWMNGGTSASYSLNLVNNASLTNLFSSQMYVAITPFTYIINLSSGQTTQITGTSSAAWGSFKNALTIYGAVTL